MKKILWSLLLLLLFTSCKQGFIVQERSESFAHQKNKIKNSTIYYLEPIVDSYFIRDEVDDQFIFTQEFIPTMEKEISKAGDNSKIKLKILDRNQIKNSYAEKAEQLFQLKKSIFNTTSLQENPINSGRRKSSSDFTQRKVFVATPKFSPEFSNLSSTFSPYFGIAGIFAVDADPQTSNTRAFLRKHKSLARGKYYFFYNIVVNVETSEVVYREIKRVPYRFTTKYLSPVIFDSFALLNKNLK